MSIPTEMIIDPAPDNNVETVTESDAGFYWLERDGVKALVCRPLEEAGFTNAFSTRIGGVSEIPENSLNLAGFDDDSRENIAENRRRFLSLFDGDWSLATVWQVHGNDVKVVSSDRDVESTGDKFDAAVSCLKGVLLGVKTADCVPVLLGDSKTGCFAAIHAGWRGTAKSIVAKAVETMQREFGSRPIDMIAAIGPSASSRTYEIGADVIDAFESAFSTCGKYFEPTREGHALIDLKLANTDQLIAAGVPLPAIHVSDLCTMERSELFFSYRVDRKLYGRTGRLLSVIGRR